MKNLKPLLCAFSAIAVLVAGCASTNESSGLAAHAESVKSTEEEIKRAKQGAITPKTTDYFLLNQNPTGR